MSTRREFLTVTVAGATGALLSPPGGSAQPKAMSVVHESSFIKGFDDFFIKKLAPEYEKQTGIKINYEPVSVGSLLTRLTTIAETKSGPEIVQTGINWPHLFDPSLLDVSDVAGEIGKKLGGWHDNIQDASSSTRSGRRCRGATSASSRCTGRTGSRRPASPRSPTTGRTSSPPVACSRRKGTPSASSSARLRRQPWLDVSAPVVVRRARGGQGRQDRADRL